MYIDIMKFYVKATIIAASILVFLAILMQLIYIRIKLAHFEKDRSRDLTIIKSEPNFVSVYGVKINREITSIMNNVGNKHFNNFQEFKKDYEIMLPYVCKNSTINVNTKLKRCGMLCLEPNDAAIRMADDCINNKLQYVVVGNTVFKIVYDEASNVNMKKYAYENFIDNNIQTSFIFILYSIFDHVKDDIVNPKGECSFNIASFLGEIKSTGFNNTIDLMSLIGDMYTVHIIGYRL